jgi:hypothetical protein
MEYQDLTEVLATHADQLNRIAGGDAQDLQVLPEQRQDLRSLLQLAEQVKGALAPVTPSPAYERKLGLDLSEVARRRRSRDLLVALPSTRRELLIGAAIGSAVALAGGIVYFVRTHMQGQSQHVGQVRT